MKNSKLNFLVWLYKEINLYIYTEWKIYFEKIIDLLEDNLIILGHSLGGTFLAKYLSENKIGKKIKAIILVAAVFDEENESLTNFKLPNSLDKFSNQSEKIVLIQSEDDEIVPFNTAKNYKNLLPKAEVIIFKDRGHFNQETFPEIVELIKNI